ncbi:enoyl-CoA delta isomerase 1, mitochondrial-like [Pieris napi]|uniref:enoyl-CoA delta isomerase 1, mitochondrial-like n=1 Tax=Pieris napi TaxID=78633 RepID=UPI001FBB1291|nr:enoyl-CoA delta isomerase 1, mitochondrial-like [Pieris napi]XP_047516548.1 enoyl-CoA delta isomerase 1, mitochondrial-like [Pieris napi]
MISIRQAIRCMKEMTPNIRAMSSQSLVNLSVDKDNDEIAIVTMQRPPVNSLSLELLQAISKTLDEIAKSDFRAMVLTSASPTVFSAGIDIMEMYKPDLKRAEQFWTTLQDVWLKLFESKFITAAAVNGHSPAGGCLLAMACEYRAMVSGKYTIGLNETALGIIAPRWFMDCMVNTIPQREAEIALTTGKLFTVEEALKVGLIDEAAKDKDDAIEKCKGFIAKFDNIPPMARAVTKLKFRDPSTQWLKNNKKADLDEFLSNITDPKIQKSLEMYIHMLKAKQNK